MTVPGKETAKNLYANLALGSGEDFEVFCLPCDRDGLRLPAVGYCADCKEHLCQSCYMTHRKPEPVRHHTLLDETNMPHTLAVSTNIGESDTPTDYCTKHKKEAIKFFCNDHEVLLCNACLTLEHTPTSCRVDYIPDISGESIDSNQVKDTLKELGKITEKFQKVLANLNDMVAKSNTSLSKVLEEITKFREDINQRLDELEKEAKDAVKAVQQENDTKVKTTETCDHVIQSLNAISDKIKHLNSMKNADQLFMELKTAKHVIQENEKRMSQLTTAEDIKNYIFEPSPAIKTLLQNEISLGTLIPNLLKKPRQPSTAAFKLSTTIIPSSISVKTSSDKKNCFITGMTASYPDQIFLADNYNYSVKMVDTNTKSIQQQSLASRPWDITTITKDKIAVTMPYIKTIQFLSFSSGKLSKKNTLNVDGNCYGIGYYQDKLAVSFQDPCKLKIMNLKGTVVVTVAKNSSGKNIFRFPDYVTTNSHYVYVSNFGKHEVTWLNWRGELLGSYDRLGNPRGLTMLTDGSFFVSDSRDRKCNVRIITSDCRDSKIVLKDLNNSRALCWCDASKSLYISSYIYGEHTNNLIKIYKML